MSCPTELGSKFLVSGGTRSVCVCGTRSVKYTTHKHTNGSHNRISAIRVIFRFAMRLEECHTGHMTAVKRSSAIIAAVHSDMFSTFVISS